MTIAAGIKNQLKQRFGNRARFDEPMSAHTSFRTGGPADVLVLAADEDDLKFLMPILQGNGLPFLLLGGGTNLLVKDGGFPGVVIGMTGRLTEILQSDATTLCAMAGAKLNTLCRHAAMKGLAGMNFAIGIPGTVGGAIRMNAGTAIGTMESVLAGIRMMFPDGEIRFLDRSLLQFGHRSMGLAPAAAMDAHAGIILEGRFHLRFGHSETLAAEADVLLKKRKASQPVHQASAGCFFKNPETGEPAGKLIDMAGLKGLRVGGAEVSPLHANYIVNLGGASAADILKLMETVRQRVLDQFNILLEPEVHIAGV